MNVLLDRFNAALRSWPRPGAGVHGHILGAANLAAMAGVAMHEAAAAIQSSMPRRPRRGELEDALARAYREAEAKVEGVPLPKPPPSADFTASRKRFVRAGDGCTAEDWRRASPTGIPKRHEEQALAALERLWGKEDTIYLGDKYGTKVCRVGAAIDAIERGRKVPPHVIPNVLDGLEHQTAGGKPSFRCDAAVVGFHFAVCEFDDLTMGEQLAFWWGWREANPLFPIACMVTSGGKSIHVWVRVDAADRGEWEEKVEGKFFGKFMVPMGVDRACRNEARLSRMPGAWRKDKEAWQELLFLE